MKKSRAADTKGRLTPKAWSAWTPSAAALGYDPETMSAPQLCAFGRAQGAREIRRLALRYGIPIKYEHFITQKLAMLNVEEEIPQELYDEIAALFVKIEREQS